VRAIPELRRAAVIAMTGFGDAATSQAVRDTGFDAHVLKPVNVEGLMRLLARIDSERGPDS